MRHVRIYELAKQLDVKPKQLLAMLETLGVCGKVPSSSLEDAAAATLRRMVDTERGLAEQTSMKASEAAGFKSFRVSDFRGPRATAAADSMMRPPGDILASSSAAEANGAVVPAGCNSTSAVETKLKDFERTLNEREELIKQREQHLEEIQLQAPIIGAAQRVGESLKRHGLSGAAKALEKAVTCYDNNEYGFSVVPCGQCVESCLKACLEKHREISPKMAGPKMVRLKELGIIPGFVGQTIQSGVTEPRNRVIHDHYEPDEPLARMIILWTCAISEYLLSKQGR